MRQQIIRTKYRNGFDSWGADFWRTHLGDVVEVVTKPEDPIRHQVTLFGLMARMDSAAFNGWQQYVRAFMLKQVKDIPGWERYNRGEVQLPDLKTWHKTRPGGQYKLYKRSELSLAWVPLETEEKPLKFPVDLSQAGGLEPETFIRIYETTKPGRYLIEDLVKVQTSERGANHWEAYVRAWFNRNKGKRAVERVDVREWYETLPQDLKSETVLL